MMANIRSRLENYPVKDTGRLLSVSIFLFGILFISKEKFGLNSELVFWLSLVLNWTLLGFCFLVYFMKARTAKDLSPELKFLTVGLGLLILIAIYPGCLVLLLVEKGIL